MYLRDKHDWKEAAKVLKGDGLRVPATARGRFRSYIVDFGREVVGSIILDATGAAGGEVVDTQVFESRTGITPNVLTPWLNRMAFGNRLTLRKGATHREQFDRWGFRYAVLTVRDNARPVSLKVSLRTALYPLDVKARFRSSDKTLNGVYRISVRAQECCMLDAYVDCPWREQAQWWGDARVQAANTLHLSADARMLARGIRLIAGHEVPNGLTYALAPADGAHVRPSRLHAYVGDDALGPLLPDRRKGAHRRAGRPACDGCCHTSKARRRQTGFFPYDERYWLFLDWADIFKEGYATVYNIFYFLALETAAKLFALIGEGKDAADCARRAEALRAAIMKQLFDPKRRAFYGGLDWKGKPVKSDTPHAYALAVHCGHVSRERRGVRHREASTRRARGVPRAQYPLESRLRA